MDNIINYDFILSQKVSESLEETAQTLSAESVAKSEETLALLAAAWNSPQADLFAKKYRSITEEIKLLIDEIYSESEKIKSLSRKMYLIEQEAKQTITEKGN